jgi:hypothetical protein
MFSRKKLYMFLGLTKTITYIKVKKSKKKKSLIFSWEGPFLFIKYLDGNKFLEQDEGGQICVINEKDEQP